MIPYLLAIVGGYLLGTAKDETPKYAEGGYIDRVESDIIKFDPDNEELDLKVLINYETESGEEYEKQYWFEMFANEGYYSVFKIYENGVEIPEEEKNVMLKNPDIQQMLKDSFERAWSPYSYVDTYTGGDDDYADGGDIDELEIEFEKDGNIIRVEYCIKIAGEEIEIEGTLVPYYTGRSKEYKFEPGHFSDEKSEKYFDENYETIEDQILTAYNK